MCLVWCSQNEYYTKKYGNRQNIYGRIEITAGSLCFFGGAHPLLNLDSAPTQRIPRGLLHLLVVTLRRRALSYFINGQFNKIFTPLSLFGLAALKQPKYLLTYHYKRQKKPTYLTSNITYNNKIRQITSQQITLCPYTSSSIYYRGFLWP